MSRTKSPGSEGGARMSLKQRDCYRCTNPDCGCEVVVTKDANAEQTQAPRCSCGQEMRKVPATLAAV
jgi:hypothetical protein